MQAQSLPSRTLKPVEDSLEREKPKPERDARKRKRRFPYRKVEELEADIAQGETELRELEQTLASPDLYRDGDRVKQTTKAFEDVKTRLQQLYEHWEEAVELN
jgi:ATP-binding cassette subfamily F protein 3